MEHNRSQLLSLPALAAALRLPENWLKAEADAGRLPHIRIGKRYRFALAAVEAALVLRAAGGDAMTAPVGSPEWRAAMVARLAKRAEAVSRRCRARANRSRLKKNTAGGLPPCRPSDDRSIPPVTEGHVDG